MDHDKHPGGEQRMCLDDIRTRYTPMASVTAKADMSALVPHG